MTSLIQSKQVTHGFQGLFLTGRRLQLWRPCLEGVRSVWTLSGENEGSKLADSDIVCDPALIWFYFMLVRSVRRHVHVQWSTMPTSDAARSWGCCHVLGTDKSCSHFAILGTNALDSVLQVWEHVKLALPLEDILADYEKVSLRLQQQSIQEGTQQRLPRWVQHQ